MSSSTQGADAAPAAGVRRTLKGKTAIVDLAHAAGFTSIASIVTATNMSAQTVERLLAGKLPNNHPCLPIAAQALKIPDAELASLMTLKPMPPSLAARIAGMYRTRAKTRDEKRAKPKKADKKKKGNLPVLAAAPRVVKGERRNSLKRSKQDLRQAVRGFVEATNFAVMGGHESMPALPTWAVYGLVEDYLSEKGIEGALLRADFSKVFD